MASVIALCIIYLFSSAESMLTNTVVKLELRVARMDKGFLIDSLRGQLHVFKEFAPQDLTYELRGQERKKKKKIKFKTKTHLRQPYKNYLQKRRGIL